MGLFDIFKKSKNYNDPKERAEWLASWCRQLICEIIMNNKSQFFKKEYINIENKRDLFVVAHEILKKNLIMSGDMVMLEGSQMDLSILLFSKNILHFMKQITL